MGGVAKITEMVMEEYSKSEMSWKKAMLSCPNNRTVEDTLTD